MFPLAVMFPVNVVAPPAAISNTSFEPNEEPSEILKELSVLSLPIENLAVPASLNIIFPSPEEPPILIVTEPSSNVASVANKSPLALISPSTCKATVGAVVFIPKCVLLGDCGLKYECTEVFVANCQPVELSIFLTIKDGLLVLTPISILPLADILPITVKAISLGITSSSPSSFIIIIPNEPVPLELIFPLAVMCWEIKFPLALMLLLAVMWPDAPIVTNLSILVSVGVVYVPICK